ncbi:hypothetical protein Pint_03798 [Pistacia integerrima]|uniref:Uncharacterized protein n=1 Tax=Pistacia integerrima TaxID=434235 RepID=A0ACC0Z5T7_9ROSI|nr:hypothetical protein Pint_03798 [Pistacia integerrima]
MEMASRHNVEDTSLPHTKYSQTHRTDIIVRVLDSRSSSLLLLGLRKSVLADSIKVHYVPLTSIKGNHGLG